ncbi:YycH family regulatory protein [Brevibacillus fulvus]|uniref:Regulatory protein YycH of two-component signal transduction system YycFG n=1 Tax=Brevibacillus fulvus TaxID=1125967 RepID=A0A938Y1V7_9BACL|nr:two-component system activity regulator YycH [Brevibacillus fulvus]MBM7591791.1 regulatory protein YycH of two-component signal transduction system YycFG [Brevibacillus fulvus]
MISSWKEPVKTVMLVLLVLTSFLLTSLLWNNRTQYQLIEPVQYVKSKPVDTKQLEDLIVPSSIVFHYGEDRHTRAVSTQAVYSLIRTEMTRWYFFDFVTYPLSEEKWTALTRQTEGLEVQFRTQIPVEIASELLKFQDEQGYQQMAGIDRIWLYYSEEEASVFALLMDTKNGEIVRARTAVSFKDLHDSYLPLGKMLPEQIMKTQEAESLTRPDYPFWNIFYLPKQQVKMQKLDYRYSATSNNDLLEAYFLDPNLVRQIVERDGTIIFTDGSRSLQLRPNQQIITFTDPAFQQGNDYLSKEDKLKGAVAFINSHLGWLDDYYLQQIEGNDHEANFIRFQQYLGFYPLISGDDQHLDSISVMIEGGQVVTMKRSLFDLDKLEHQETCMVMSGPELYEWIRTKKLLDPIQVKNAYLGYQTHLDQKQKQIKLRPVWVVETVMGTRYYINAVVSEGKEKGNGLE